MLDGQVAVISGSALGIGRGVALGLAARGVDIVGLDIDAAANREMAEAVRALHRKALPLDCDVGNASGVYGAFDLALRTFGRIDILINNAAVWLDCGLTSGTYESQTEAFARSLDVCARGSFHCARAAVPAMINGGGGNIVNIVTEHIDAARSIAALPQTGYDCAKFAQWRLTEAWAAELKKHHIRVNALCMGAVDTPMLRAVSRRTADAGMKVEDIATAVVHVLAHGVAGPTGQSYRFGFTGTPRETSLQEIAALAP